MILIMIAVHTGNAEHNEKKIRTTSNTDDTNSNHHNGHDNTTRKCNCDHSRI